MNLRRPVLALSLVVGGTAVPAHAEWLIAAHVGGNVAGDVEVVKGGPGGSIGYLGDRFGFEVDLQRYQHFFKDAEIAPLDPEAPPNCMPGVASPCTDINTDAFGASANFLLMLRRRDARWRPYGTAGLGLLRAWTEEAGADRSQKDLSFDAGGGVLGALGRGVGLRADLRYVRALADESQSDAVHPADYAFWRASVGVTFRFGAR